MSVEMNKEYYLRVMGDKCVVQVYYKIQGIRWTSAYNFCYPAFGVAVPTVE
ncbi:hypothetical protein SAMN05444359_11050 [Neolewinella agarilytica]|uniref:Uncharacterized protein n=1 Tax=Neolewinella agarilytica TaxID=478744 RepID=A0A1H9G5U9_9BACT|nr:hypothetical protein SAMN05444359_11050 [Neolewinella agarilytica]